MLGLAMTPTLLELIVAALLLWIAWQIGVLIAPRILASFLAFWRSPRAPLRSDDELRREKNINTPGAAPGNTSTSSPHGRSGR